MSQDIESLFAVDEKSAVEGRWIPLGGAKFLIARAGVQNEKFSAAYAVTMRPLQQQQRLGVLTDTVAREALLEPFLKHVLLNWDGLTKGGEPFPFTKENAKWLLKAKPDLFNALMEASTTFSTFAPEQIEDTVKN